ncbi:MAG: hypothetical protein HY917_00695 [Candidatus Diapherotrites archaeon]|nr:hypothetical protein [Candidatus Diapherotrites archaeon]
MRANQLVVSVLSVIGFWAGAFVNHYFSLPVNGLGISDPFLFLTLSVLVGFIGSMAAFGYLGFFPLTLWGVLSKSFVFANPELSVLLLLRLGIGVYAGSMGGEQAWKELNEGKPALQLRRMFFFLLIALVIAALISQVPSYMELNWITLQ